jgi:hypothetical protein
MQTQYTETQLSKLIADVEQQFSVAMAKAEEDSTKPLTAEPEATLAKAEDESPKPKEKKDEEKPEAKPEASAKPEGEAAPKPEGEAPPAPAEGQPAAAAPQAASAVYDQEDLEHMRKMYQSMSQEELKLHHDCIMECVKAASAAPAPGAPAPMGKSEIKDENKLSPKPSVKGGNLDSDPKNGGIEGCEPCNALGPKSPASDANGAKINKSEHARRNGGKIEDQAPGAIPGAKSPASKAEGVQMEKSEGNVEVELLKSELAAEKEKSAKFDDLKKQFDGVQVFLTKLLEKRTAPPAKAITGLEPIAKSEGSGEEKSLSKSEIDSILVKKASDPTLKKSDREAINTYYLGDKDIKGISHLLK